MNVEREEQIRARAHAIWEEEGRPEGKSEEHWRRACEEVALKSDAPEGTDETPKTTAPKAGAARKPKAAAADTPNPPAVDAPKPVTGDGPQSAAEDAPTIATEAAPTIGTEPAAGKLKRAAAPRKPAEPGAKPRAGRAKSASKDPITDPDTKPA